MYDEESRVDRIERENAEREVRIAEMPEEVKGAISTFENLSTHYPPDHPDTDTVMGDLIRTGLLLANYIKQ